jgi:hypothetical protein
MTRTYEKFTTGQRVGTTCPSPVSESRARAIPQHIAAMRLYAANELVMERGMRAIGSGAIVTPRFARLYFAFRRPPATAYFPLRPRALGSLAMPARARARS